MSSFWGIVFYMSNIILLGLTTKNATHVKRRTVLMGWLLKGLELVFLVAVA